MAVLARFLNQFTSFELSIVEIVLKISILQRMYPDFNFKKYINSS